MPKSIQSIPILLLPPPSTAPVLGIFTSSSRVFEVVYVIWWYMGPFTKTTGIDFMAGASQFYLLIAAGLLLLAAFWRFQRKEL